MPPTQDDRLARIEAKQDEILGCLQGDLKAGKPGLLGRVERLEHTEHRRGVWSKTAVAAGVTAVCGSIWALMTGKAQ
jgi:hypothetical protein